MGISIAVLGAGSWGTTLAILLAEKGHNVFLWAHRKEFANELNLTHENKRYLPGIIIPERCKSRPIFIERPMQKW